MKKLMVITLISLSALSLSILWATTKKSQKPNGEAKMESSKLSLNVVELEAQNAEQVIAVAPTILIIDFYAEWCGPCKGLKPIFENIADEFKNKYMFAKINADKCPEILQKYNVGSLPTILIFSHGQVLGRITGLVSKEALLEKIDEAVKGPQDLTTLSQEELDKKLLQTLQMSASVSDIKPLLEAGANVNATGPNGLTPLLSVIFIHMPRFGTDVSESIELLLSYGASTEFPDTSTGKTLQASEFITMMGQNYTKMAQNCDKLSQIFKKHETKPAAVGDKQASKCTGDSCTL